MADIRLSNRYEYDRMSDEIHEVLNKIMEPKIPKWYLEAFNWLTENQKNILIFNGYNCKSAEQWYIKFFRYYELSFIDDGKRIRLTCKTGRHDREQFKGYDSKFVKIIDVD